jgi:RimJ/RimL family protein N-acetyltransferase
MEILRITPGHIESYHQSWDHVARERKYFSIFEAPPLARTREFLLKDIAKGHARFVGVVDGEVAGWCEIIPFSYPAHAHVGELDIALLSPFRGRGFGKALMEVTVREVLRNGLTRIKLGVFSDNTRAIALYEKIGFVREGALRDHVLIDGHYQDLIMMAMIRRQAE